MTIKKRMTVMIPESAYERLLAMAGSERKLGETVTGLIQNATDLGKATENLDLEGLRLQIIGLTGAMKGLESRQLQTERTLAALIANSQ